jgi:DNA-binding NarL/FixJ family response regulator
MTGRADAPEPIRVLVVDDHELFRRGISQVLLGEEGIEVVGEAEEGASATALAQELLPDVVLMDVRMPGTGGIEAARRLAATLPATRVLMLTVSTEEEDLFAAVRAGVAGYLLKEIAIEEVAGSVRAVAGGQTLVDPSMASRLAAEFVVMARRADLERGRPAAPRLTPRELDVLQLVAHGLTNRDIGARLFISENTVKNHVRNVLGKLHARSRMGAVLQAVKEEILDVDDTGADAAASET